MNWGAVVQTEYLHSVLHTGASSGAPNITFMFSSLYLARHDRGSLSCVSVDASFVALAAAQ